MTPRERVMALIVGGAIALCAVYYGVQFVFIEPLKDAKATLASEKKERSKLQRLANREEKLARRWKDYANRTFSFDAAEVGDQFGEDLKRLAEGCGFTAPSLKSKDGIKLAAKTDIISKAYAVSVTGDYNKAMKFLRSVYETSYLTQVTKVSVTAPGPKEDRSIVRLDFEVETLVLPVLERDSESGLRFVGRTVTTMPAEGGSDEMGRFRKDFPDAGAFALLDSRNIFRRFMPAPTNMVMVDNQDRKTVGLRFTFFWEGKVKEQFDEAAPGKSQKPVSGKGDRVEITGVYADGTSFGPKTIEFGRGSASYKVAAHTPDVADRVILAVTNQDENDVFVNVTVTTEGSSQLKPPKMVIPPGQTLDVGDWKASSVLVSATYASGVQARTKTYTPSNTKQTHIITTAPAPDDPKEPVEVLVREDDPEPDARYRVTGLWTYEGAQEMIATSSEDRIVIARGEAGAVDGGLLLAVHPLGGIVKMPSGNYYIYPLGKSFSERVLLNIRQESDLPRAIDEWTRR